MSGWLFLAVAIVVEVAATLSLRVAATGRRAWYLPVGVGYLVAFGLLSLALREGCRWVSPTGCGRPAGSRSPRWPRGSCSVTRWARGG